MAESDSAPAIGSLSDRQLFEIEAMLRVSGLSARALAMAAGLDQNTIAKARKRLPRGGKVFEGTMERLRDAMRRAGHTDWLSSTDETRLRAAILSATKLLGSLTPYNAAEAAAMIKETLDDLMRAPNLSNQEIQIAADSFANGFRRRAARE